MSDGDYHTHVEVGALSPTQRQHLDGRLRSEGIQVSWAGDRLSFDQAFEARVEAVLADVRSSAPPAGGPPPGSFPTPSVPAYPPSPYAAGGYPAPYGVPGYGGMYPTATTNSNAVLSLILGLCSFAICGVCCIPAIILGRRAEREIAESQGSQTGAGLAKAGWIIGAVYAGLIGVVVLFFLVFLIAAAMTSS